ncbi:MAG: hypothetical protein P8J89_05245 [Phycisphaerales bacterium]|nr:hypothetical protein [Phycisphaerales bacterium]|tara:strand:- start:10605 stop:10922 length:318 start_codon:yes stop_codon:yes gene_type:complete
MSPDTIVSNSTMSFTITGRPQRAAKVKTIERLMGMQSHIQNGRSKLATQRRLKDNVTYVRAGRPWVNRKRVTKLARAEQGETFTLLVTPQIVDDLRSVASFLETA